MSLRAHWLRLLGLLIALLLVPGCDGQEGDDNKPAPGAPDPIERTDGPAPRAVSTDGGLGEPPPPVADAEVTPDCSTPEKLLHAILDGRANENLPLLARLYSDVAEKAQLDKLDTARAWRDFCMPSMHAYWDRVEHALDEGLVTFETADTTARARIDMGGSLGTVTLNLIKVTDAWCLQLRE